MMNQAQKLRYYCDLSEQTASDIIAKRGSWMNFLDSAASMYKYSFAEQLLIHAQRPGATACAPIELWNTSFKRWVQPGVKGIALIDDSGTRPKLKYVFDVADTHTYGKNAPQVKLWELREEHKSLVLSELAKIYDDVDSDSIAQTFHNIASQMATEYYDDNAVELGYRAEGSFLEDLDSDNVRVAFVDSVSTSMAYLMMKRCGFDTEEYFTEDDFNHISSFNTPDIIHSLGETTSDLSQQVLRDVELVVKKYERQKASELQIANEQVQNINMERDVENERDNTSISSTATQRDNSGELRGGIYPNGGLSSAEHTADGGHGREAAGQVRNDEEIISENQSQNYLRSTAVQREPVPPLQGSGGISGETPNPSAERDISESDPARQRDRPGGLDSGDEHNQGASGGIGTSRTDLRRDLTNNQRSSQLGTKMAGEVDPPPITENLAQTLSTSSITADEVDSILRDGGNSWKNSVQRIAAHYAKDLPLQDNADYLRDEYLRGRYKYHSPTEGGKGFQFGNDKTSVWWNEDGIKIGRGDSAMFARDFAFITWEQAAERIGQLYDAGHFVNHDVLEESLHNEYSEIADDLLSLYRDDFRDIEEIETPENWGYKGTWPDTVERITELLKDKGENGVSGEFTTILTKLRADVATFEAYEGELYRQYHDLGRIAEQQPKVATRPHLTLRELEKLSPDPVGFPVANIQNLNAMRFIANDEIDSFLVKGSSVSEGKMRIFSHFLHEHTPSERISFLKDEYGWGGGTWLDGNGDAQPSKGITLKRPGCEDINLSWPAVAKRIGELVQSGRYMPNVDLDRLRCYENIILSRQIVSFFETLPMEERHQSPFGIAMDFYYPKQAEYDAMAVLLEDKAELDACLEKMAYIFANTSEDDRYYNSRESVFRNLTAFSNGEYNLFPEAELLPSAKEAVSMPSVIETAGQSHASGRRRGQADPAQLSIFETSPFPELPSATEQQTIIEQSEMTVEADVVDVAVEATATAPEIAAELEEEVAPIPAQVAEPPPQAEPLYKIGDVFQIDDKPWQIEKFGDTGEWVHLKNLGEPSTLAVFDHTAVHRSNFDELLRTGKIHAVVQEPVPKLSPRLQAIADTAHNIPPDRVDDITLYQVGDFYEAYDNHADKLATLLDLSLTTDNSDPDISMRVVGFPIDKLDEYTAKIQEATEISFNVSNRLADGTRDLAFITHPFYDLSEWEQYVHIESKHHAKDYTEPFVVIQNSESPNFEDYERLTFTEADLKFKEVESSERELRATDGKTGGYHKTNGAIFYKNAPEDTELSTYEFRYDIGSYNADESGLYNHINSFWETAQEYLDHDMYNGFTQAQVDNMRATMLPLLAQHRHLETMPVVDATPKIPEIPESQETPQVESETENDDSQEQTVEAEPLPTSPPPVFFVDWDNAQYDFDLKLYQDRDVIGYNKDGVETKLGRMGDMTYITTTGAFRGSNTVPGNIYGQIEAYRNGEVTEEQVRENYLAVLSAFEKPPEPAPQRPLLLGEQIREELYKRGFAVSDELISNGVSEYNSRGGRGNFENVSDFIEDEFLAEEPELVPDYDIGETVYLEDDKPYVIDDINEKEVTLRDPSSNPFMPFVRITPLERFEREYSENPKNLETQGFEPKPAGLAEQDLSPNQHVEKIDGVDFVFTSAKPQPQPQAKGIVEQILSPGAEVYDMYSTFEAIKAGYYTKHDTIRLETDKGSGKYRADGVDALLLKDLLANPDDPRFYTGGSFYERDNRGAMYPHMNVTDVSYAYPKITEAGYKLEIDGKLVEISEKVIFTLEPEPKTPLPPNFRITDDNLGAGGAKTKYRANIDAIKTLQAIEADNRHATPNEMETLSRYVGWGGIAEAFDDQNTNWRNEYAELRELLSPEEYDLAKGSVLNAHYTSPTVIKGIYDTVERLGFSTGNLLEPAMGVGNFFGLLPDSMQTAKLYGVELDSISARISKQLYPNATIKEMGYEKTDYPDSFFDVAVGNVPFGGYGVHDKRYDKHKFMIHDYFFSKTLDQVRPGGIIAFVTSKGTLDKQNPDVRKYLAQRAELLGAVRLPNTAFKANAGTEVTTDIIFLQKRDRMIDIDTNDPKFDWVHLGNTENGIPLNRYFVNNPEMVLGEMVYDDRLYGNAKETSCNPLEGADLADQLKTALFNIHGQITVPELDDLDGQSLEAMPADPSVRNFSFTVVDDRVYFRENSMMYPVEQPATTLERIKGMIGLRDCVRQLIDLQVDEHSEDEIKAKQVELNTLYDKFTKNYGLINASANNRAFATGQFSDNAYYLLCSLEILDEDGKLKRKGDMFTKRTIKQNIVVTHVDTATEALAVSMGEKARVDMAYMSQLTGKDEETLFAELQGIIYADYRMDVYSNNIKHCEIRDYTYQTADEFLSGNIRQKLKKYSEALSVLPADSSHYNSIKNNVEALEKAMPKELEAHEINLRLGTTWIDPAYVQQFMYELLKTSWHNQSIYQVKYHNPTGEWQVSGKGRAQYSDIHATVTYGTKRMNAYEILSDTLNLKDARVYDYKTDADGKQIRELNKKETMLAQQKQEQIKQEFKNWIFKDPDRREKLVKLYNEKFNSTRPREYDGSHITFSGISPEIKLRPHQLNAIAHILYGGNTLLAHEVGAGKTFEIVAAAMESKRLGLSNKNLIAVPNHLTEQWASEWLRLYPSANILVATKKDFEMRNRKKFIAKIATGDYDAVIIGHTQLEKIPLSAERQQRILREQISEIEDGIREVEASKGDRFTVKQLTKTKKSLEARLAKLMSGKKRDDVIDYEQLGISRLYVDESHFFKNLALYSKMRNVAGLNASDAQKSSDLFMKTRYMDELTTERHGRPCGTIFATGTPISNSIAELYTIQRYLQYDLLMEKDLSHFDAWASTFCEPQTSIELSPEGSSYRARTRLASFHNLPELMSMFKEVADIQTADMLDLPVPKANFQTVIAEPSEMQREMVQELSERATAVQRNMVDKRVDNMLKITTDGRKIGLDQRLMNPLLEDFEGSKINAATDNILRVWEETTDERLTQLVFSDFSTPNKDGRFNIYEDIRSKLIERGIPEHEIEFIHNADSESKKKELFAKVRQGKVRVLFGSTAKMGAGTNVQDRLIAIHDVDCPWRPADLQQRAGRIIRQGNNNEEVSIFRYATAQTFDSYLWQTVEAKQKFIAQIMTSKSPVRSCEDVDETALSYAEIKALCAGNPLIAEKMNLDIDVARLRMIKADFQSQRYRLEDDLLKHYPKLITGANERIAGLEKDITLFEKYNAGSVDVQMLDGSASVTAKFAGMTVGNKTYTEKEPAAKAILDVCKMIKTTDKTPIGEYMGFEMALQFDSFSKNFHLSLKGSITHSLELGTDAFGNITRINNVLSGLPVKLVEAQEALVRIEEQQAAAKEELDKPFTLADELAAKELKLAEINTQLNIGSEDVVAESVDEADVGDNSDGELHPKLSGADFLKNVDDFNDGKRTDFVDDEPSYDDDDEIAV